MITKTVPISTRIAISQTMKQGIPFWACWKVSGNQGNNMIRFSSGGRALVEQFLVSEERKKSKRAGLWLRDLSRKVNHLRKVIWDRKILTEFTRSISSTAIGKPVLMMDVKVSKDKHISRWVDRENLIYVRWNKFKSRAWRQWRWSIEEK